jgi:hypothetical protein
VGDNIGLLVSQVKILLSIFQSLFRMVKAVEPVGRIRCVPVVEKVIVEQSTPEQALFFTGNAQKMRQFQTEVGHGHAVEQNRGIPMLYKLLALRQSGAAEQGR